MTDANCAVILAGGAGRRLRPYTTVLPKPLMPIGETPIIQIVLQQLRHYGFERVFLTVRKGDSLIRAVVGDGCGLDLVYSEEPAPLSTIAPLRLIADQLPDAFLVMNGDLLTDLDFGVFLDRHRRRCEMLSVGVVRREQPVDYGVVEIRSGRAVGFREKPVLDFWVSMGVYGMDRGILDYVPPEGGFGFDELMLAMLRRESPIATVPHSGPWHDIGRPDDFELAVEAFARDKSRFLPAHSPSMTADPTGRRMSS